jgi:N-acyl-D-amino-acid deacylase
MKSDLAKRKSEDFSYAVIASFPANRACNGKNIVEAAQLERGSATIDDQIETILNIETRGGATGVFHGMSEDDLMVFMRHPNTMFASDSGVRRFQADVPHPRGYGNNARILGRYVREKKVIRLEDAVRRMTSLPAKTYQLQGRGEISVGACADLAVFDPETVSDPSTFSDPHHYAIGFRWVIVNGQVVVESDQHNGAKPGQIVRRVGTKPWPVHAISPAEAGTGGE